MLRQQTLACFKKLHKTRRQVFREDTRALEAARNRINEEFQKHKNESDPTKIKELQKFADEVETVLRKTIVQVKLKEDNTYEARPTKDTMLWDNIPYKE